jgi:CheY-like chemotaxis protein
MSINILVIDDVQVNRDHFQGILSELGTQVMTADSGEEGIKLFRQHRVDAVFLDYNMPGINGFDFIALARNIEGRSSIPIVMMSTDMAINQTAVKQGLAQAWLTKRATRHMVENVLNTLGIW